MSDIQNDDLTTQSDHPRGVEVEQLDLQALGAMIRERRGSVSLRQAAGEVGVSFSTLTRAENGAQPDLASYSKICAWLGVPPSRFFTTVAERDLDPLEQAITHLRQDPRLTDEAASSIAGMLKQMYSALAKENVPQRPMVACHLRAAPVMRPGVPHRLSTMLTKMHTGLERLVATGDL